MTDHPSEDLAAYAIGALDRAERAAVDAHLPTCAACRADLEALGDVAWSLAESASLDPPARTRGRLLDGVRSSRSREEPPLVALWRALTRPVPIAIPVALAVAVAFALVGLREARTDADAYARAVAGVADGRVVALAPTSDGTARGALVVPSSGSPYLILQLPAAPAGKTWEAWVIRGERPLAAGITGERSGLVTLVLSQALVPGDVVAVTLEEAGGVAVPRGQPVLLGKT
ncbi:MAG: anti-sigma factor [Chloroflexi bacterium]|nr:anti-sigma factor [Chloroflexota bacterium]